MRLFSVFSLLASLLALSLLSTTVSAQSLGVTFYNSTNCNSTVPNRLTNAASTYIALKTYSDALQATVVAVNCAVPPSGIVALGGVRMKASCVVPSNGGNVEGSVTVYDNTACTANGQTTYLSQNNGRLCLPYTSGPITQLVSVSITCDSSAFRAFQAISVALLMALAATAIGMPAIV